MSLAPLRRARRALAPLAILAYGLPLAIGLVAGLGHGARHLGDTILEQKTRAVALGLVHAATNPSPQTGSPGAGVEAGAGVEPAGVVHTHDGSTHAHSTLLGALLSAADDTETGDLELDRAPSLALHLPATSSRSPMPPTLGTSGERGEALHAAASDGEPLHPPPRA